MLNLYLVITDFVAGHSRKFDHKNKSYPLRILEDKSENENKFRRNKLEKCCFDQQKKKQKILKLLLFIILINQKLQTGLLCPQNQGKQK